MTKSLVDAAKRLSRKVDAMTFELPVTHVYNPLRYAWKPHQEYLRRCNVGSTRVLFLGMNPGPWGMAQTGVPFGQVAAVRDWLNINDSVVKPPNEHPKRPIEGFACKRSEVSGARLWGLFETRFETPEAFFAQHFVVNYCPLVFMEASGKNRTPDKLPAHESGLLEAACDEHLSAILGLLQPQFLVGIGAYAEQCFRRMKIAATNRSTTILRVLHPSPASPAANKNWAEIATSQLVQGGVWWP